MITSTSNAQVKNLILLGKKAKARKEQGVFLVEGRKLSEEAPRDWIKATYVTESYLKEKEHQAHFNGLTYETLSDSVMKAAGGMQTPQGILTVVAMPEWDLKQTLEEKEGCYLLLEGIQDPGNLGTMLRTGEAAGITAVIANAGTVDVYNPKTVRATMGSIYRVPFFAVEDFYGTIRRLKARGINIYAAHLEGKRAYDAPDYRAGSGFLIGNEGNGLSDAATALADESVRIPMEGRAESLNASVAAAILMYEANRQKRR